MPDHTTAFSGQTAVLSDFFARLPALDFMRGATERLVALDVCAAILALTAFEHEGDLDDLCRRLGDAGDKLKLSQSEVFSVISKAKTRIGMPDAEVVGAVIGLIRRMRQNEALFSSDEMLAEQLFCRLALSLESTFVHPTVMQELREEMKRLGKVRGFARAEWYRSFSTTMPVQAERSGYQHSVSYDVIA